MPGVLPSWWRISGKTARFARRILPTRAKAPAAGGSGNRISATEGLFTAGEVMVVERRNFHRVYDLTRRVMPDWDDERDALSREDAEAIMLRNSARSLGIFRAQWLADYYRLRQPALPGLLAARQEEGLVVPVNVEALGEMWLHHEALAQLETAPGGKLTASHSAVLSPFDPVVWDRKRAEQLFNFSYRRSVIPRRRSVSMATSYCLCCTVENWSGGWTVKYIAKAGSWRSSPCGWRRGEDHPWSGAGAAPGD